MYRYVLFESERHSQRRVFAGTRVYYSIPVYESCVRQGLVSCLDEKRWNLGDFRTRGAAAVTLECIAGNFFAKQLPGHGRGR